MDKHITNRKLMEQAIAFEKIKNGELSQTKVALILGFSDRWVRKKYKRFLAMGPKSLVHQNNGKPSNRRISEDIKLKIRELLEGQLHDAGPTYLTEKLEELNGIKVSAETVRKWMSQNGFWKAKCARAKHRKRRDRKPYFGMMIQFDGSKHDWFEGRASKCTLLVFIDDATSELVWLEFVKSESLKGAMKATWNYFNKYGRPKSFYVDYGAVFSVNINNPERDKLTQFERAMNELDVEVIHASSPQAKGRVERAKKTLQDRLIKKMRLAYISSMEEANLFVQDNYIKKHNSKFAVIAAQPTNVHRSIEGFDLRNILCIKQKRSVQNDFTIAYNKRLFQLESQRSLKPKDIVTVCEYFDGSIVLVIRKTKLAFTEIKTRSVTIKQAEKLQPKFQKPAANHPWKKVPACSNSKSFFH
jgi:transposase